MILMKSALKIKSLINEIHVLRDQLQVCLAEIDLQKQCSPEPCLTLTQMKVAKQVRDGMTSKEIAIVNGVAVKTILNHRDKIRKVMGVTGDKRPLGILLRDYAL